MQILLFLLLPKTWEPHPWGFGNSGPGSQLIAEFRTLQSTHRFLFLGGEGKCCGVLLSYSFVLMNSWRLESVGFRWAWERFSCCILKDRWLHSTPGLRIPKDSSHYSSDPSLSGSHNTNSNTWHCKECFPWARLILSTPLTLSHLSILKTQWYWYFF